MKKVNLLLVFILLLTLLQGCSLLVIEEDSEAYRELSSQYNQYAMNDVVNFDAFKKVMNNATNLLNILVFMIETNVLDLFHNVISSKYGTGTLIFKDQDYYYILTTYEVIDLISRKVTYFVSDAYGDKIKAEVFASDSDLGLGILRMVYTRKIYPVVKLASYMPMSNELVLMIANNFPTQNVHKLGFYLDEDELSYMEVLSSQNANGSPIFNLRLEMIGIQFTYNEKYVHIVDYQVIDDFVSPLLTN